MNYTGRTLSPAVLDALTYWPGTVEGSYAPPVDLAVLPPFFDDLLWELPWWNRAWRVTEVEPAYPREVARSESRAVTRFTEVSVPGTVSSGIGDAVPFSARVRFEADRLIRLQAKVGDIVLGPAAAAAGRPEPHPFGAVFSRLMDLRGISVREMAEQCGRAQPTIKGLRSGYVNPHWSLVRQVAGVLRMSEEDLAVIAGLDLRGNSPDAS